jgi:predicted nucleic acid-binding protein
LDSSVLVKRYLEDPGTESLNARLRQEEQRKWPLFVSVLSFAEIHVEMCGRIATKLLREEHGSQVQDQFEGDWLFTFTHIEMDVSVLGFIRDVLMNVHLKSADAIHLASALRLQDALRLGKRFGKNLAGPLVPAKLLLLFLS